VARNKLERKTTSACLKKEGVGRKGRRSLSGERFGMHPVEAFAISLLSR
jgi:hypothetical protein